MTNLNSILKSRDITLPTKVNIVKIMVFPLITHEFVKLTILFINFIIPNIKLEANSNILKI